MRIRRLLSLLVAFALMLGMVVPSQADAKSPRSWFTDVLDTDWSLPYVLEMHAKGLMRGTGNGLFQPNDPLTRAQAVTVAVRLMGLEDEAEDMGRAPDRLLPFTDRDEIADWARSYVAVAVDHEILPLAEDGLFRADEKASRLWVSVLLVRALGYDAEAQSKMEAELPFRDADVIPASLVGYVAAAVDHELVQGFPDRTFQPNQPITRAQAAALLSRTDGQLGDQGRFRPGFLAGELVRVSERNNTLTLKVQSKDRTLDVDSDAPIFLDDRSVDLGDLPVGARVSVVLDSNDTVLMVIARKPVTTPNTSGVKGEITSVFLPSEMAGGLGLIVIESGNRERSYPLAPQISVKYDGRSLDLDDLRVGDQVTLEVIAGVAISINVTKRGPADRETTIKGTITGITPNSTSYLGRLNVRTSNNKTESIKVAPGAVITSGGNRIDFDDLQKNDQVTIKMAAGVAIRITVDKPARVEESVKGTIQTIYPATKNAKARIKVKTSSGSRTLTMASNVVVSHGNSRIRFEDLRVGDEVTVSLVNGTAEQVKVTSRAPVVETVKGSIEKIEPATRTAKAKVTIKTSRGTSVITLSNDVAIRHGNTKLRLADLRLGDRVEVTVVDGTGTEIKVTDRGPLIEEVTGTIEKIEPATRTAKAKITIKTNRGTSVINLSNDVAIRHGNTKLRLTDLRLGDWVEVTVVDGTGTEIKITDRGPEVEEVKGTIEAVYAVSINFQSSIDVKTSTGTRNLILAPSTTIKYGRNNLNLDDLRKGDKVTVTVVNGIGTEIKVEERGPVAEEVKGTIEAVYEYSIDFQPSIEVKTANGNRNIKLAQNVAIKHGRTVLSVADLRKGDKVTVKVENGVATEIRVEERGPVAEEVKGWIENVYAFSINFQSSIEVKTANGNRSFVLAPEAVITHGNTILHLEELQKGDKVTVTVVNDIATEIKVEERANQRSEVKGQVLAIYTVSIDFQPSLLLLTDEGSMRVLLGSETTIKQGRNTLRLRDLKVGDRLTVKLVSGVAESITLDERPGTARFEGRIVAIADKQITLRINSKDVVMTLADDAELKEGRKSINLDDLRRGDQVELEVKGSVILKLNIERRASNDRD